MPTLPPPPFYTIKGHESSVTAIHFTDEIDNAIKCQPSLISGSEKGEIFIWDLQSFRTYHRFVGHSNKMIVFLKYYKSTLMSQGRDGILNIWEFSNEQWTVSRKIVSKNMGFCAPVFFQVDVKPHIIIFNEDEQKLEIYDYDTANKSNILKLKSKGGMCMCLKAIEMDNKIFILTGYESGYIGLWDLEAEGEVSQLECHKEPIMSLDYDVLHKNRGISGSPEEFLETWTITENLEIVKVKRIAVTNPGTSAVKIRDDGKIVLVAGYDSNVRVFSWKTLKLLAVLTFHKLPVQCLACCPLSIGKYTSVFASGSKDENISLWSLY